MLRGFRGVPPPGLRPAPTPPGAALVTSITAVNRERPHFAPRKYSWATCASKSKSPRKRRNKLKTELQNQNANESALPKSGIPEVNPSQKKYFSPNKHHQERRLSDLRNTKSSRPKAPKPWNRNSETQNKRTAEKLFERGRSPNEFFSARLWSQALRP